MALGPSSDNILYIETFKYEDHVVGTIQSVIPGLVLPSDDEDLQ